MPAFYVWDGIADFPILQPHLQQKKDACSFCATARQLEYCIRIQWAKGDPSCRLRDGPLILQEEWKQLLLQYFSKDVSWNPENLLSQACGEEHCNPKKETRYGVPLYNKTIFFSNEFKILKSADLNVVGLRHYFLQNIPLVGVIEIREDYHSHARVPYLGTREPVVKNDGKIVTHAVVLVGEYIAEVEDQYELTPGVYWIFQNSPPKDLPDIQSLLGNGLGILHPRVLKAACYGFCYPPNLLARAPEAMKIRDQQDRVAIRRRKRCREQ